MDVRRITIRIPGQWEDAWLYRESLIVWDRSGQIYSVALDSLRRAIERVSDHHHRVLSDFLVLRSEHKSSSEFRDALGIAAVRREFFAPLRSTFDLVIEINDINLVPAPIEPTPGNLTDTAVYGNRVFITSDAGVYETQFDSRYQEDVRPLLQATDGSATAVVAGNGQFAASLGELGLIARAVGFGDGDQWTEAVANSPIETLASYSRTVARSSVHLVNYGESPVPEFIRATTQRERRGNGFEESIIVDFEAASPLLPSVLSALNPETHTDDFDEDGQIEILGNANYRLLVRDGDKVQVLNMRAFQNRALSLQLDRRLDLGQMMTRPIRHALSTQALRSGFLIEHTEGVHILTDNGVIALTDGLVVQARSFPNSRRYVDTVVLVQESSLDLIGFIDLDTFDR